MTAILTSQKTETTTTIFDNWEKFGEGLARLVARAWIEPEFERLVVENPRKALEAINLSVGENVEIEIDRNHFTWSTQAPVEREGKVIAVLRIPLPHRPAGLTDENLRQMMEEAHSISRCGIPCFC